MIVIGLVGGVASGKSTVAGQMVELGGRLVDGDQIGHRVLDDERVVGLVRENWGPGVIADDGRVDRRALAAIVFSSPPQRGSQLRRLERITHPRIATVMAQRLAQHQSERAVAAVVDAAVLFKAGWERYCDQIVFVDAPREQRCRRASGRGWTDQEWGRREAAQLPLEYQRRRATQLVFNDGSAAATARQVKQLWDNWRLPCPPGD